jgi:hypothetical protein
MCSMLAGGTDSSRGPGGRESWAFPRKRGSGPAAQAAAGRLADPRRAAKTTTVAAVTSRKDQNGATITIDLAEAR